MPASSFISQHNNPLASPGQTSQGYLPKYLSTTPNEPNALAVTPTPTPSLVGHVPVTIYMGNVSDLSFIYVGGKLAYVQFYSKDEDRVIRIAYEDYRRLACMGKITYYGALTRCDHGHAVQGSDRQQGAQEKATGLNKYIAPVQEMMRSLRGYSQGMINGVRTVVVPAVEGNIIAPLRGYSQGMINKVRTTVT